MLARVKSGALLGVDAYIVEVEVDLAPGLPAFTTVGLPETAVKESKDRVRAAVKNSGYKFPGNRITINLAPADIRKEGTGFDLPVAVGILAAQGLLPPGGRGELSSLRGAFPGRPPQAHPGRALHGPGHPGGGSGPDHPPGQRQGGRGGPGDRHLSRRAPLPGGGVFERPGAPGGRSSAETPELLAPPPGLRRGFPGGPGPGAGETGPAHRRRRQPQRPDGRPARRRQDHAGPEPAAPSCRPGVSKRPWKPRRFTASWGGSSPARPWCPGGPFGPPTTPFRTPASSAAAPSPGPGEVSLAHHGVLFLDELPEFRRSTLEVLRQPLEEGKVTISRAATSLTYPARFMLVAAMNPCPCGFLRRRQTGLHLHPQPDQLLPLPHLRAAPGPHRHPGPGARGALSGPGRAGGGRGLRRTAGPGHGRPVRSRRSGFIKPASMPTPTCRPGSIKQHCAPGPEAQRLLETAMERLGLSARAYHRILKIARTIADLEGERAISPAHVAEAIQYRTMDRKFG